MEQNNNDTNPKVKNSEKCECPRVPPLAQTQLICELIAFILCVLITSAQLGLIDFYFVHHGQTLLWLLWIVADCLVIAVMCWLLHFAINYSRRCLKRPCASDDDENIQYAFVVWLVYSLVLLAKIATFFPIYSAKLIPLPVENETDLARAEKPPILWGPITLKFILALSAVIFLLLVLSHHYNRLNKPRANYLSYLSSAISIDLLDSVLFLELLVEPAIASKLEANPFLKAVILILACFNFVLPTFSLFKLRYRKGLPSWVPLPYEKLYALFYLLFVNVPYLVIRAYLWRQVRRDVSIFLMKNLIMITVGMRDVWMSFLLWKKNKARKEDDKRNDESTSSEAM